MTWMLNEIADIDGHQIWEPCGEYGGGHALPADLIVQFKHAKECLIAASIGLKEAYDMAALPNPQNPGDEAEASNGLSGIHQSLVDLGDGAVETKGLPAVAGSKEEPQ